MRRWATGNLKQSASSKKGVLSMWSLKSRCQSILSTVYGNCVMSSSLFSNFSLKQHSHFEKSNVDTIAKKKTPTSRTCARRTLEASWLNMRRCAKSNLKRNVWNQNRLYLYLDPESVFTPSFLLKTKLARVRLSSVLIHIADSLRTSSKVQCLPHFWEKKPVTSRKPAPDGHLKHLGWTETLGDR